MISGRRRYPFYTPLLHTRKIDELLTKRHKMRKFLRFWRIAMKNNDKTGLDGLVKALAGVPVMVAGDIMLDRFVYGSVERISPESPVPVLSVAREEAMLGGAGNALANLAGLKAKGVILSVIGDDENGKSVRKMIKDLGFDDAGLLNDAARPTIVKTRYLAGHQQLLRSDHEQKGAISDAQAKEILKRAEAAMKKVKALLISDYGKGMLRRDVIAGLIKLAKAQNISVIVDPKGNDFSIYGGADVVTPNRKELSEATRGGVCDSDAEIIAAAEEIISGCNISSVIATRSKDGMSVIAKGRKPVHLRGAQNIEVFDVSGAGDTVIATITAALAAGASLEDAATLANIAGSIAVTKVGTAPIRSKELSDAVQNDEEAFAYADKKAPLAEDDEAAEQARRWRAKGLKIGFTNGCFDILHAGHVTYLNAARGQCDRLIVGLNRDDSVKLLKGPERPVHDEESRAAVLAALASVDMVVLFGGAKKNDDNTAIQLIELLKPDVYFKGGDYKIEQIPEAPLVKSNGGSVIIIPAVEGQSTTASLRKIKNAAA